MASLCIHNKTQTPHHGLQGLTSRNPCLSLWYVVYIFPSLTLSSHDGLVTIPGLPLARSFLRAFTLDMSSAWNVLTPPPSMPGSFPQVIQVTVQTLPLPIGLPWCSSKLATPVPLWPLTLIWFSETLHQYKMLSLSLENTIKDLALFVHPHIPRI